MIFFQAFGRSQVEPSTFKASLGSYHGGRVALVGVSVWRSVVMERRVFVASSEDGMACLLSLCPSLQTYHVFGYKRSLIASLKGRVRGFSHSVSCVLLARHDL